MNGLFPAKQLADYTLSMFRPSESRRISAVICGKPGPVSLAEILAQLYTKYGIGGLMKGNAIMFGWALALTALSDLFLGRVPVLQVGFGAVTCFFMCHVMDDDAPHALMITAFIILNCFIGALWVITELFVIMFEHICMRGYIE